LARAYCEWPWRGWLGGLITESGLAAELPAAVGAPQVLRFGPSSLGGLRLAWALSRRLLRDRLRYLQLAYEIRKLLIWPAPNGPPSQDHPADRLEQLLAG
jgi:hypothetical protein